MKKYAILFLAAFLASCGTTHSKAPRVSSINADPCSQLKALHEKSFNPKKVQSGALSAYLAGVSRSGSAAGGAQAKANYLAQMRQGESNSLMNISKQCLSEIDSCAELTAFHEKSFNPKKVQSGALSAYLAGVSRSGSAAGGAQAKANFEAQMQQEETNSLMNISKQCS